MTPRPLTPAEARASVAAGTRWAWQLEAKLAAVYATLIVQQFNGAALALETRTLTAAAPPVDPGWSVPNEDEIGEALRRKYELRADVASTAIRVEAMRRTTKKGLELMHVSLDVVNPLLEGVLEQLGGNIEIDDTTRGEIMRELDASWKAGDSIPRAAQKLRAKGAEISKSRSVLIARTELIGAINAGAHAMGEISNEHTPPGEPPLVKIWLTAEDEKVRTTHIAAGKDYGAGKGIPLDQPFHVGESSMQFPGDQTGSASEVCNCRCALSYEEGVVGFTASIGGTVKATFKGRALRATGALTASGLEVFELDPDALPEAVDPAAPADEDWTGDEAIAEEMPVALDRSWTACLGVTGVETADGRMIGPGGVRWRELPLTLTMQFELEPEHMGALSVGRIDEIEVIPLAAAISQGLIPETETPYASDAEAIIGRGAWDDSMLGDEAMRMVRDKVQRGVSLDFSADSEEIIELAPEEGQEYGRLLALWPTGEIMGATVCAHPAFAEANIIVEPLVASGVWPVAGRLVPVRIYTRGEIKLAALPTITAAAVDYSSHSMIALHPTSAQAAAIAQPGGQPAGDLHLTLAYLPNADGVDFDALHKVVAGVAAAHSTITGKVGGLGYFAPDAPVDPDAAPEEKDDPEKPADDPVTAAAPPEEPADPETDPDSEKPGEKGDGETASSAPLHPHVALIDAPGLSRMRASLCDALDEAGVEYAQNHDFTPHLTLGYEEQPGALAMHCAGADCTFSHLSVHQGETRTDHPMSDVEPAGITASAAGLAPVAPPAEWFTDPMLEEPTPLTITADGQIYGHLATWGTCHMGVRDACVQPPSSESGYAFFHLGHVEAESGELVPVGTFTMDTGHAPLRDPVGRPVGLQAALAHYDNTGTAVADVRCGEDEHGIWFAGAIRPDLPATKVRALRAAQISGDWRPVEGRHEFAAGLAVNVPGYPVVRPRTAIAASGQQLGLVAAGVDLRPARPSSTADRLSALERILPGHLEQARSTALARLGA